MKRLFLLIFILFIIPQIAYAEIDLSEMSYGELIELKNRINLAMWNSQEWQEVTVPQGVWKVGEDIPEGHWTIIAASGANVHVTYGNRLTPSQEIGYDSAPYIQGFITHFLSPIYDKNSDMPEMDIDMKTGYYVKISGGNCIFTPYTGKPTLGFKGFARSGASATHSTPDGYASFDYATYSKAPGNHIGEKIVVEGYIVQVGGGRSEGYGLMFAVTGEQTRYIYAQIPVEVSSKTNLLVGDHLRIYAILAGEVEMTRTSGGAENVLWIIANAVEFAD